MPIPPFDPYAHQASLLWRNRVDGWRSQPAESIFSALAWLTTIACMAWLTIAQLPRLREWSLWLREEHAWATVAACAVIVLLDQRQARRQQRLAAAQDWLSAQPIPPAILCRRRRLLLLRLLAWFAVAAPLLAMANVSLSQALLLAVCATAAALIGNALGDIDRAGQRHTRPREAAFPTPRAHGNLFNWQCIEAGASLAPRHLAPLLLVILLVPRGPLMMALVALLLLLIVTGVSAWKRAVMVIVQADRWLLVEPISTRIWLLQSLRMPVLMLLVGTLVLAMGAWMAVGSLLALAVGAGLPMLGLLYLGVAVSGRAQARRIPLRFAVHTALLAACAQALPPLLPLLFGAQLALLFRRALNAGSRRL
ncbi:MAG: hypothetical protein ACT4NL_09535 [Pseudomarimonas sp.]